MNIKRVQDWEDLEGEVVLLRSELNVPLKDGVVLDDGRIKAAVPTIKYLQKHGARVVILSHLGRPKGKDADFSLRPVAEHLAEVLGSEVEFVGDVVGTEVDEAIAKLDPGEVLLLENIRFYKEEEENDQAFAERLAKHGSYYVNDAFGVIHRNHVSVSALARLLPAAAGLLVQEEIDSLSYVKDKPPKPFVVIIGGAKVKTKIGVIRSMMRKADHVIIGGALGQTMLAARGHNMGGSFVEEDMFNTAMSVDGPNLILPVDVVLESGGTKKIDALEKDDVAVDIGPETLEVIRKTLQSAKTVLWNGPLGKFEDERGGHGTQEVARILGALDGHTIVGGGETIQALERAGSIDKIDFVSTGGGAMLAFVEGITLPGLEPLIK